MAYVVVYRRGAMLMHHRLGRDPVRIGKSPACEIQLPDRSIARHQGAIVWEDGRHRFEDRSGKQTPVNGKPVEGAWLKDRDYIDFGAYRAHFHDVDLEENPDAASAVRTAVEPRGTLVPLPEKLWLSAQLPTGGEVTRVELGNEPVEIGTELGSDLRIQNNSLLSTEHCQVARHDGALYLSDLGSTNGTWARGLRILELTLPLGERFRAGRHDFWVSASLAEAASEAASFEGLFTQDAGMLTRWWQRLTRRKRTKESIYSRGSSACHFRLLQQLDTESRRRRERSRPSIQSESCQSTMMFANRGAV